MAQLAIHGEVEDRRHHQRGHRNHEHGAVHGRCSPGKTQKIPLRSAHHNAEAQHQQQVSNDAAGKRGFDYLDMSIVQGKQGNDEFSCVSQAGIKKSAHGRPGVCRQRTGAFPQHTSHRRNGQRRSRKNEHRGKMQQIQNDADRNKYQQAIQPGMTRFQRERVPNPAQRGRTFHSHIVASWVEQAFRPALNKSTMPGL